ncbi:Rrf2 family transcriptional regulator [Angustibacter speluncae]
MRLTARVDYALRAACALAATERESPGTWSTSDQVAAAEGVPQRFLEAILRDLRRAGVVDSRRGQDGGHRLAVDPSTVTLADLIRAVDGPLALVRGTRPEDLDYQGASTHLQDVWLALRSAERRLLEGTTLAHVASGELPDDVRALLAP